MKDTPTWSAVLVALIGMTASGVAFSYSTFVTIRERDILKGIYEERLVSLERKQDEVLKAVGRIEGKLDSIRENQ